MKMKKAWGAHLARAAGAFAIVAGLMLTATADATAKIRIAFPDVATVEYTHFLAALERAREKGVEIDITYFTKEELASQAVVNGDADVGVGSPFALIQKVDRPIRFFLQMSKLRFYVVVNTEFYNDWQDLDGQEIAVHARGSGTEAVMNMMAVAKGIQYSNISYVPGSEVRSAAMLQGNLKATVVDSINRDLLLNEAPGKFKVLPVDSQDATNDALYASAEFLNANADEIDILVEAILTTWRDVAANPDVVEEFRNGYHILPDLSEDVLAEMLPYYRDFTKEGALPLNGGDEAGARADLAFYSAAGAIEGDPASLDVNDFWDFGPVTRVVEKLGKAN